MSVRKCLFPWHLVIVTMNGEVRPCCNGSKTVGNLGEQPFEEIWNGPAMQEVREAILKNEVHPVCESTECPFQREHPAIRVRKEQLHLTESFARDFDEEWYLSKYPDVRLALDERRFSSGLEHYLLDGIDERKQYRLRNQLSLLNPRKLFRRIVSGRSSERDDEAFGTETPRRNAILTLLEYSRGATVVRNNPVDVVLALTTRCNYRCVMCPQGMDMITNPHDMPLKWIEALDRQIDGATKMVADGLGEPTLSPGFWALAERIKGRDDLYCRTNSNGSQITPETASKIVESGLAEISVSVDAATPETYRKIRGDDLSRAINGVENLVRARRASPNSHLRIYANMTLMMANIDELVDFVKLCGKMGVDAADISQLFSFGDKPEWKLERDGFEFIYSDQMIQNDPIKAKTCIQAADKAARQIGIRVRFTNKTDQYL